MAENKTPQSVEKRGAGTDVLVGIAQGVGTGIGAGVVVQVGNALGKLTGKKDVDREIGGVFNRPQPRLTP